MIEPPNDAIRQREFTGAMIEIYRRVDKETGYRPTFFLNMVNAEGGYQTAFSLVHGSRASDGFLALLELKRLDLTMEAVILLPQWHDIFTDEDRIVAYNRLIQNGYAIPADSWHPKA